MEGRKSRASQSSRLPVGRGQAGLTKKSSLRQEEFVPTEAEKCDDLSNGLMHNLL